MSRILAFLASLLAVLTLSVSPALAASQTTTMLQADCSVCVAGSTITLTGTGFDPKHDVLYVVQEPNGTTYQMTATPDSSGNTSGSITTSLVGTWTVTAYEYVSRFKVSSTPAASCTFQVVSATP